MDIFHERIEKVIAPVCTLTGIWGMMFFLLPLILMFGFFTAIIWHTSLSVTSFREQFGFALLLLALLMPFGVAFTILRLFWRLDFRWNRIAYNGGGVLIGVLILISLLKPLLILISGVFKDKSLCLPLLFWLGAAVGWAGAIWFFSQVRYGKKYWEFWSEGKAGFWGILGMWGAVIGFFYAWTQTFFLGLSLRLLSGKWIGEFIAIFNTHFDTRHAGFCMDQPTLGKYMFWLLVFSVIVWLFSLMIRLGTDGSVTRQRWAFMLPFGFMALNLFSMWLGIAIMLTHYIYDMGWTQQRFIGVLVMALVMFVWIFSGFIFLYFRRGESEGGASR